MILSDRAMDYDHVALPSLLAVGAVHHHLVKTNNRTRASALCSRPAKPAKCITTAMLIGYGADAINPYLAFETLLGIAGRRKRSTPRTTRAWPKITSRPSTRACSR